MFSTLPRDIILSISMHLTFIDICKLKQTCKRFHDMSNFDLIYQNILKRDYNYDLTDMCLAEKLLKFALCLSKDIIVVKYLIEWSHKTYNLTGNFPMISHSRRPRLKDLFEVAFGK